MLSIVTKEEQCCTKTFLVSQTPLRVHQRLTAKCIFAKHTTVHSVFFSKTLFDFKKSISGLIELKFSGKTPNEVLYAPIYFWGVYF